MKTNLGLTNVPHTKALTRKELNESPVGDPEEALGSFM